MKTLIKKLGDFKIPDPEYGDMKLNIFPWENGEMIRLPIGFELWEPHIRSLMSMIPKCPGADQHYVTIDSKFFPKADFLRREGVHIDGNFCVDPNFKNATWGGTTTTWGGSEYHPTLRVIKDWELPYNIEFPVGDYVSEKKGGLFCVSSEVGCQAWSGEFHGEVGNEGSFSYMQDQLKEENKVIFEKDKLYFMTSNTPHETLKIDKGKRRTFIRITLNHEYPNKLLPFMKERSS